MASDRPDIVVVMTDQQRADSLGYAGNRFVHTPNLDRLAAGSLRFRNAVTPFPLCSPARACLWTGRHAHRHGVTDNVYGEPDALARRGRPTLFPAMRDAGYRTGYIGKWHLGEGRPDGFDHWDGYNSAFSQWIEAPGPEGPGGRVWRPHRETDEAIALLEQWSAGPPFLLVLSYYPPHPPYDAPDRHFARHRGTGLPHPAYYAAVDGIDVCVGRLLEALDRRRPQRASAVVFLSDHGDAFQVGKGSKRSVEEAALRVPLLLRAPGLVPADIDVPASLLDVAPTLAGLAGVALPGDGADLRRIADGTVGRTAVIVENVVMESVATRDGNLRRQIGVLPRAERAVWSGRAKLSLRHASAPGVYDLAMDPEERQNLWRGRLPDDAAFALATGLLGELARAAAITEDVEGAALGAAFGRLMDGAAAGSDDR